MKANFSFGFRRHVAMVFYSLLAWLVYLLPARANPTGGTVTQGSATITPSGSQLTINQSSASALINWSTFNIAAGETTTFMQPSSSAVAWNQINDANPSQIFGNLNANGYVVLQNQSGFYVGGSAAISAHGLVMTTSPTPAPDLSSGGAWQFNTPPPAASIINYGQITVSGGGSLFLIANDIENRSGVDSANNNSVGTISAPGGRIGLFAGQQVLVSTSPDGRGLSAKVTLPQGSVDNEGKLIADAGTILAQAQTVNNNGLVQANSVQNVNGVIELVASGNLSLGANSDLEAHGDNASASASPGGFVVLQAGGTYADTPTSQINVAGGTGAAGGQAGIVEIFGNNLDGTVGGAGDANSVQSIVGNPFALLLNPYDLTLSQNATGTSLDANNNLDANFNVTDLAPYSRIDLHALDNIELSAPWSLNDPSANNPGAWGSLNLEAGNSIILDDQTYIQAGNNWEVNLTAGTGFTPTAAQPTPPPGGNGTGVYSDGIYLNGSASVQSQNGDINLWAANEVQINNNADTAFNNGITTLGGGSITVVTAYGDVNTGGNSYGYDYNSTAPYYTVDSGLGGISTAAGGNVSIQAGGNVYSYVPFGSSATSVSANDAGTGAFGPEPGNVTISAGRSIYGHYVLADGLGSMTAGQNIGALTGNPFALSLIDGSWNVNALNGTIYLQEVRNPNGVFNNVNRSSAHTFDYAPQASVDLNAAGVELTGIAIPRPHGNVPILYPPILDISAGAGGVTLVNGVTLFPSAYQSLVITTADGGNLVGVNNSYSANVELALSDSSRTRWVTPGNFGPSDEGSTPTDLNDPNPVQLNISGNLEYLDLIVSKAAQIKVGGSMVNCGFSGENLHASDVTSITVTGQIYNQSAYAFVTVPSIAGVPAADVPPGFINSWSIIFTLAVDPSEIANLQLPAGTLPSQWYVDVITRAHLFGIQTANGQLIGVNPGFLYDATTGQFGFGGAMSQSLLSALSQPITVLHLVNGVPVLDANGHFETDTFTWAPAAQIQALFAASQPDPAPNASGLGYRLGGPGQFDINAGSIALGNSDGILSCGVAEPSGGFSRYGNLASLTSVGGTVNVTVTEDQTGTVTLNDPNGTTIAPHPSLDMLTSTIAALGGGDVNVTSTGGSMDLGSEALYNTSRQVGFGVLTSGGGNVNVVAQGDINIDGSRIATYNGGNILVESLAGNVDVGTGGDSFTGVGLSQVDPTTKLPTFYTEEVYGNGIVADTWVPPVPPKGAKVPGNITVETPQGNITASLGGITQEALNGTITAGPTITLEAGTPGGHIGNIDLGKSGVIGGTVNATANGNITGLIISRQNSDVHAQGNFSGAVLAGGSADVAGGGSVSGTIVGVGGASVSGGSVTAQVLSQNASVNGAATVSTLGSSAGATSTSQAAAQQSGADTKQELATTGNSEDDDKKKKKMSALLRRIKRVTVLLPKI